MRGSMPGGSDFASRIRPDNIKNWEPVAKRRALFLTPPLHFELVAAPKLPDPVSTFLPKY